MIFTTFLAVVFQGKSEKFRFLSSFSRLDFSARDPNYRVTFSAFFFDFLIFRYYILLFNKVGLANRSGPKARADSIFSEKLAIRMAVFAKRSQ